MSYHPTFSGSPIDPDSFPTHYEGRPSFPRAAENRFRLRNFTPSARKSGEDILKGLKESLSSRGDRMFFNDCFFTPDAMFSKADEAEDGSLRGRPPHQQGFRVPGWLSEDQDMSDLAARMSHAPHFATMGRRGPSAGVSGGPWRERRHSGGSAMSVTSEDDSIDAAGDKGSQCSGGSAEQGMIAHEIPIRFEAPAPPQQQPSGAVQDSSDTSSRGPVQCPVRTTSAVDASEHNSNNSRAPRCASAPPEMAEQQQIQQQQQQEAQQPQRFVSKISITPQAPPSPQAQAKASPPFSPLPAKFNTVPRPFVPGDPQQQYPPQQYPPQQQYAPQQYPAQPPLGFFPPQQDPQWQYQQQQYPPQQYPPQQYPPQQAQQEAQAQQRGGAQRPSVVRNIPIFVEGRDDPVEQEAKPAQQWTQPRPQQPAPQPPQQPQPPPPQPTPRQKQNKRQTAHQPTPPPAQPIPHAVPMPMPESYATPPTQPSEDTHTDATAAPTASTQQEQQAPTPPAAPAKDPRLLQIEKVKETVGELSQKVKEFEGTKKDREFLYLDEMLTRALLQLDNVDPDGCDEVRQARRTVIKDINAAISNLESAAKDPVTPAPQEAAPNTPADSTTAAASPQNQEAPRAETQAVEGMEVEQLQQEGKKEGAEQGAELKADVST